MIEYYAARGPTGFEEFLKATAYLKDKSNLEKEAIESEEGNHGSPPPPQDVRPSPPPSPAKNPGTLTFTWPQKRPT